MGAGSHATFIVLAYAAAAAVLAALVIWTVLDYRAQRRALAELERQGIVRRSGSRTREPE